MLEERPILQKTLIGAGAFSFVFTAAMAGSAFMISGGFGFGGDNPRPSSLSDYATVTETAWSDWAAPPAYASTASYSTPDYAEQTVAPAAYADHDLNGDASNEDALDVRSETDILRDIEREFAAPYDQAEDASANYADAEPAYEAPADKKPADANPYY